MPESYPVVHYQLADGAGQQRRVQRRVCALVLHAVKAQHSLECGEAKAHEHEQKERLEAQYAELCRLVRQESICGDEIVQSTTEFRESRAPSSAT